MNRKWLVNIFVSMLALFTIVGCNTGDQDRNNAPLEENNDRHLENNIKNDDRDRDFNDNQDLDSNLREDDNLFNEPNDNENR